MRLGGNVYDKWETPEQWVDAVRRLGYRAAYCPVAPDASEKLIEACASAAREADIVIAEVGAWSNPLSPNPATRDKALHKCKSALALADRIGARCCVNIAGSRGEKWDGPCALDMATETFDMIVTVVREIIDEVKPTRSFYTLETMPWMYPDSADSYLALVEAIDRTALGVHFDPVNLISSPQRYFRNGDIIREFVEKLGHLIKSCHAKDILLGTGLTVHLDEVRPGLGGLDYQTYLRAVAELGDIPLMIEHLPNAQEFAAAADHIRRVARQEGIGL
ncbi:MAG: TIM barrel protein [Chitinivibrionales bacterium]|nr:TIM barrel protein [Chitinivibrionales bacterium]